MPRRGNQNLSKCQKKYEKKRKEVAAHAMADCVFSPDIMMCILVLLPVRSLLRFKSVCKPWRKLFASPKFIKEHHDRFSDDPRNRSLMIYSLSMYYEHTMSLLDTEKGITKLDHPYPEIFFKMDFIGCCIGLVCITTPPMGQPIVLWNPAMKLWKFIRLSDVIFGVPEKVSVGFAYDAQEHDFMLVKIVCLREKNKKFGVGAEVYSANSGSWETIEVSCNFDVLASKNDAIVNGNPYWVAKVVKNENDKRHDDGAIVCFDVKKKVFDFLPVPTLSLAFEVGSNAQLVDWNGSLGFLLCNKNNEWVKSVDVYVFDGGERSWSKKHTFGPMGMGVSRLLQYSKSSKILGEFLGGKLFLYDTESKGIHETLIDEAQPRSFVAFEYSESLACIKGMEQVAVKKEEEEEVEMEEEEEEAEAEEEEKEEDEEELTGDSLVNAAGLSSYLQLFGIPTPPVIE